MNHELYAKFSIKQYFLFCSHSTYLPNYGYTYVVLWDIYLSPNGYISVAPQVYTYMLMGIYPWGGLLLYFKIGVGENSKKGCSFTWTAFLLLC